MHEFNNCSSCGISIKKPRYKCDKCKTLTQEKEKQRYNDLYNKGSLPSLQKRKSFRKIKECLFCWNEFYAKKSNTKFCNSNCSTHYKKWYNKLQKTCKICGADSESFYKRQKVCSKDCRKIYTRRLNYKKNVKNPISLQAYIRKFKL